MQFFTYTSPRVSFLFTLILLPLLTELDPVRAQSPTVGLEIGGSVVAMRFIDPSPTRHPGARPSYSMKTFVDLPLSSALGLQAGLRYVGLGARIDAYGGNRGQYYAGTERIFLTYLTVPLHVRVRIIGPWFITTGPEFGYLLTARSRVKVPLEALPDPSEPSSWEAPLKPYSRSWNQVLSVAVGRALDLGRHPVQLQLGYAHGLSRVGSINSNDGRTQELLLSIGFLL